MQMVMMRLQEQMRMQQLMMAASKTQKQNGGGAEEGPGGVQSEMNPDTGANPPVNEGETQMPTEMGPG